MKSTSCPRLLLLLAIVFFTSGASGLLCSDAGAYGAELAVSAGESHSLLVTPDGTLLGGGWSGYGALARGSAVYSQIGSNLFILDKDVVQSVAGKLYSIYLKSDGPFKWTYLPLIEENPSLLARTLALNCLTSHYTDLWAGSWDEAYQGEKWLGDDTRLNPAFWRNLTPIWTRNCALRSDFERRWALVELDVLAARALGLTLTELQAIYRIQFPVLRQNEEDTWYDQNGRIVFSARTGAEGFERTEWIEIRSMQSGTVTRTVTDTTLPTGPVERTLTYTAPFTRSDRESDYATVWRKLEAQK